MNLESGQNSLWQWNTGQRLVVSYPVGTILDFTTGGNVAIRRDVYEADGCLYVDIPNALLQSAGRLYVYVHRIEGEQLTTVLEAIYPIRSQPKPPDYIDDEDEILIWHQLEEQVRADAAAAAKSAESAEQFQKDAQASKDAAAQSERTAGENTVKAEKAAETAGQSAARAEAAAETLNAHNNQPDAHADIRLLIQQLTQRLDTIANSDDVSLDQLHEIVTYIKDNRDLIEQVTTGKVSVADIVNNLTTNAAGKPLSAAMGVELKRLIEAIKMPTKLAEMAEDSQHRTVTDEEKEKWNAGGSGTDISLGMTSAKVGQLAKIKAIDESGKVTEWEPVDMPSGRDWKLLGDITVSEQVAQILIDVDKDYDEFQFYVWVKDRITATASNLIIGWEQFTSTSYALAYSAVGTNKNFFMRGKAERNCNTGWIINALCGNSDAPLSTQCGKASKYYSTSAGNTEHPKKINANLQTGFDPGSRFVVYAR